MPSLPTCIGHEVGGEKAELFILRSWIWFWPRELFSDRTHLGTAVDLRIFYFFYFFFYIFFTIFRVLGTT